MKIFKTILAVLGGLFLLIIVLAGFAGYSAHRFKVAEVPFVRTFMADIAPHWEVQEVYGRLSNSLIEQLSESEGKQFLEKVRLLGPLAAITDFEQSNYNASPSLAEFKFKASFAHGKAVVDVQLMKKNSAVRVNGVHMLDMHIDNDAAVTSSTT